MTYREMAVETVKLAGQELIDRAEELVPNATNVKNIDVWIRIPTCSEDMFNVPEIEVPTDVYPSRVTLEKYADLVVKQKITRCKYCVFRRGYFCSKHPQLLADDDWFCRDGEEKDDEHI